MPYGPTDTASLFSVESKQEKKGRVFVLNVDRKKHAVTSLKRLLLIGTDVRALSSK
jgi:hypothetical protein